MKKTIAIFVCLCTGLTLKPMNEESSYKLVKQCFGLEVYEINNPDDDIHCTIRFFTKKIQKLNEFNTEINEENSFQKALKFGSSGPIAVISTEQLRTSLSGIKITNYLSDTKYSLNQRAKSKKKLEKNTKDATVQTFLETLRNSLKYYDLKKQKEILLTKHHGNRCIDYTHPEIEKLNKTSSDISSITNYTDKIKRILRKKAQIAWKEKIAKNREKIAKILGENETSDEAQGANNSEEEEEEEEEYEYFEDRFTHKKDTELLRSIVRLLEKIDWKLS